MGKPPKIIAINHDDYHAKYIGRTTDRNQFFITPLFVPKIGDNPGCEYVAKFIFNPKGELIDHEIVSLGPRANMDHQKRVQIRDEFIESLGKLVYERIQIAPFCIEQDGKKFGLIIRKPETKNGVWAVELLPGNFMAFFEPWDSGIYDT